MPVFLTLLPLLVGMPLKKGCGGKAGGAGGAVQDVVAGS